MDEVPGKLLSSILPNSDAAVLQCSVLNAAQGSAYVEQGNSKILCAVYGPREIPRRQDFQMSGLLKARFNRAPFSRKGNRGAPQETEEEKERAENLKQALSAAVCLHLYPKSQIDVFVTVLEDDGCVEAAAITCAGIALANASIKMFDLIVGASLLRANNRLLVDPAVGDESDNLSGKHRSVSKLTIAYMPTQEQIAALLQRGDIDEKRVIDDIEKLIKVCKDVVPKVQSCLLNSIQNGNTEEQEG